MVLSACNAYVRKLPKGELTTVGGTNVKLRMPGIIPQKVNFFHLNFPDPNAQPVDFVE